jgi:diacylglycerol kinase family enzyme
VRALLIVNPIATSTTRLRRDVIVRALASAVELSEAQTGYPGHAAELAAQARSAGYDVVLTLGGDGTVNEAVNGLLGPACRAGGRPLLGTLPALAALPGGGANVFTGALGLPRDLVDAAGVVLEALAQGRRRTIGVGLAHDRYFLLNAGLGLDAEVVRAVHGQRAQGRLATPALYVRTALRQFYAHTDRRHPALTIEADGGKPVGTAFVGMVLNTTPWTYLGSRPLQSNPDARFERGLDLFALRSLSSYAVLRAVGQMLYGRRRPGGRSVVTLHDQQVIRLRCGRATAFQIDGEYVGERDLVEFRAVPEALQVIC